MAVPELYAYFDMDGVLVRFDEDDAATKPCLVPGSRYFRDLPPDTKAVDLMRCVDEFPKVRTSVLTRLVPKIGPDLAEEHEADKLGWCVRYRLVEGFGDGAGKPPFRCLRDADDKTPALAGIPTDARRAHVLVDDDPAMVRSWKRAGGTAFLYVQSHRHIRNTNLAALGRSMSVPEMAARILSAAARRK